MAPNPNQKIESFSIRFLIFFVLQNVLFGRQFIHSIHSIRIESFETKLMANKTLFLTINRPSPSTNWGFEFIETEHKRLGSILVVQNVS